MPDFNVNKLIHVIIGFDSFIKKRGIDRSYLFFESTL